MTKHVKMEQPGAKALGLKRYYTGRKCRRGHRVERLTSSRRCVVCHVAKRKAWREKNPIKLRMYALHSYYKNHDKNLARGKKYRDNNKRKLYVSARKWRLANPEAYRLMKHNQRKKNPEVHRTSAKRWQLKNPEAYRVHLRNKKARKRNAKGRHAKEDINRLFFLQRGKCATFDCSVSIINGYHVDHKTPLARGGSNWPRNLQLLCQPCNGSKGIKTQREWIKWRKQTAGRRVS